MSIHLKKMSVVKSFIEKVLFKKRAKEGLTFILEFFIGYLTFFIAGYSSIAREQYIWVVAQLIISLALLIATLFAKRSCPAPRTYSAHKKLIKELKRFSTL